MSPRLLDLCCKAGGCTKGYQRAGFHVTGVDIDPQPNYCGDAYIQADALAVLRSGWARMFDVIHASPPCPRYMRGGLAATDGRHPDLLPPIRDLLIATGRPYVIENVPGAPMRPDVILCGSMFGLEVRRHRWFESNAGLSPLRAAMRPLEASNGGVRASSRQGRSVQGNAPQRPGDVVTGNGHRLDDCRRNLGGHPSRVHRVHRRSASHRAGAGRMTSEPARLLRPSLWSMCGLVFLAEALHDGVVGEPCGNCIPQPPAHIDAFGVPS